MLPDAPIAAIVTAGLGTIAIRVPAHPAMQALLAAVGKPLAAPSANASGRISPSRASHVLASLGGRIPLIVDAGPTERGIESTIIAATDGILRLLRRGPVEVPQAVEIHSGEIESPGQLASHYAPVKPLRLNAIDGRDDEYLIGFGDIEGDASLSEIGDPVEAAARLFELLHQADASPGAAIAIAPIPGNGIAAAIRDRLQRAAASHTP
jgi:L-threonylcarbamoyladenylate synthase